MRMVLREGDEDGANAGGTRLMADEKDDQSAPPSADTTSAAAPTAPASPTAPAAATARLM